MASGSPVADFTPAQKAQVRVEPGLPPSSCVYCRFTASCVLQGASVVPRFATVEDIMTKGRSAKQQIDARHTLQAKTLHRLKTCTC